MSKFKKSEVLMLFLLAALVFITPLLSSSLRPTYLYFVINLLIIAVGAEAGLLSSAFSKPPAAHDHQDKTIKQNHNISNSNFAAPKPLNTQPEAAIPSPPDHQQAKEIDIAPACNYNDKKSPNVVEKSASEKIVGAIKINKVKKCPSTPSLFFIGGGGGDQWTEFAAEEDHVLAEEYNYQEEVEEEEGISGQELFTKAEMFIGNFYKQLKMQREESWKKIHGFYQKAF